MSQARSFQDDDAFLLVVFNRLDKPDCRMPIIVRSTLNNILHISSTKTRKRSSESRSFVNRMIACSNAEMERSRATTEAKRHIFILVVSIN